MLASALKNMWHRDLVSRPETHAWVLSLYRAGELHPQTVDDYFPAAAAEDPTLREQMERHAADETRHVRMYDRAIARLGQERRDFDGLDVFNVAIRRETAAPHDRFDVAGLSPDERREKLAHFLAHAHFLERRIARSLDYHLDACERERVTEVIPAVSAVMADEQRHAGYTVDAVRSLLRRARAAEVLEVHRRGEARANLTFSARQVRTFLADFGPRLPHALVYRTCASMMEAARAAL